MRLLRLEIENFGKLQGFSMELTDGLNVICRDNGFGKTTLAVFIKAMLYGLPASTKRDLDKNERKKYAPWQGGNYGGSLEFESEKGRFRIERFFAAKEVNDEFRLYDLSTNKASDAYSANVGIELFGIDAEGFARSAYLAQNGMDSKGENVSVTAKLTGLLEDVNDMGSYDDAMETLEKHRRIYEVKGGRGRVSELNERLSAGRRELDRLNELHTAQKQQETALTETKAQIATLQKQQQELNQQLRLSEQRRTHLTECQRIKARIHQSEQEKKALISSFREGSVPTNEELTVAKRALQEVRIEQSRLQALALPPEEAEALNAYRQRYPKGRPSPELLTRLHTALNQETELRLALQASPIPEDTPEQSRFKETSIPSDQEIATAINWARRRDQLQNELLTPPAKIRPRGLLRVLAVLCLLPGGGAWLASALVPSLQLILQIIGSVAALLGIALLILGRTSKRELALLKARKAAEAERNDLTQKLTELLRRYGFLSSEGDLSSDTQNLIRTARHARDDESKQETHRRRVQQLRRQSAEATEALKELFAACGFSHIPKDPQAALVHMHADLGEWEGLARKAKTAREQEEIVREDLSRKQAAVSALLSRLTEKSSSNPEERMERIEGLCREHTILEDNLKRLREELAEREALYEGTAPQGLPDEEALLRRERELADEVDQLHQTEIAQARQWNRSAEQTQGIPALEDELAHLSVEYAEAERRLKLLKNTEQFLTEAKEALSTRYLEGMQQSFDRYRSMLENADPAPAVIDTAFAVSVRAAGKRRESESFSRGERDILQLCARLALTASMFAQGERPPLLLDDPFVNLDEAHLAAAKELLEKLSEEYQVLYTVCHPERC